MRGIFYSKRGGSKARKRKKCGQHFTDKKSSNVLNFIQLNKITKFLLATEIQSLIIPLVFTRLISVAWVAKLVDAADSKSAVE